MSKTFPRLIQNLIDEFSKMPGIGEKSAQRLVFYILGSSRGDVEVLLETIKNVKSNIGFCEICNNISEGKTCQICMDTKRDRSLICVVESPSCVMAMEKSGNYRALYHVLLGSLSPIDGVGPDDIKVSGLIKRVKKEAFSEVIIATDFTTEGETTALYIVEMLKPFNVKVTRLARGVPVGAVLEYADAATLHRALEERRVV